MNFKALILLFFALIAVMPIRAQSVGLVLSGGGAKGMAHIGVIRVLEENNIPIDYIAGTSIGAIVGGLYAAGYTPDEMEELFKSDNFYFWSTGKIQREYLYYFKRHEPDPSWLEIKVEKKGDKLKVLPPTNLIPAEQMDFAFMELLSSTNAACSNDFDSLMVPFFCVATDVNRNQPVILRKGDLGAAVRASMTVPFYFKPITIDGALLFDGGIFNNFPHDVMKETYKPDIIIGHKVANDIKIADSDDLMRQIANIVMRPTNFEIDPKDGILLESKFDNVGLLDFNKIEQTVKTGQETTTKAIDSIKKLIHRRVTKESVEQKRIRFNAKKPELYFQNIQVEGIKDPQQRKYIIQSIKHRYDVITLSSLKKEYFKLIADQHIKSIMPVSVYNPETGYFDLNLQVEPNKQLEVKVGGNISTKPINQGFAGLNYRIYQGRAYSFSSNIYFGRFYSSFKGGARIDFSSIQPFYLAGYFTLNRWDFFSSSSELFFEDVRPPYIIQNENNQRFEIGTPIGRHSKLYGGIAYSNATDQYYLSDSFFKVDTPDRTAFKTFSMQIGVENNSLNFKEYATEGSHRYFTAKYITGKEKYTPGSKSEIKATTQNHGYFLLEAHANKYFKMTNRVRLGVLGDVVFSNKEPFQSYRSTLLSAPGFYPTPHSKTLFIERFHSNNYLAGGLSSVFMFNPSLHFRLEGYGFVPVNEAKMVRGFRTENDKYFENYYLQGAASLVYQTGAGPLSLALHYYDKPNTQFYFYLNFGYVLFNKRGF